jgi:hypothetical protein
LGAFPPLIPGNGKSNYRTCDILRAGFASGFLSAKSIKAFIPDKKSNGKHRFRVRKPSSGCHAFYARAQDGQKFIALFYSIYLYNPQMVSMRLTVTFYSRLAIFLCSIVMGLGTSVGLQDNKSGRNGYG